MKSETSDLKIGEDYAVELYPKNKKVEAKCLGKNDRKYIFVHEGGQGRTYILVDEHWMRQSGGIITYTDLSSAPILTFTKKYLKQTLPNTGTTKEVRESNKAYASKLLKILEDLGEKL